MLLHPVASPQRTEHRRRRRALVPALGRRLRARPLGADGEGGAGARRRRPRRAHRAARRAARRRRRARSSTTSSAGSASSPPDDANRLVGALAAARPSGLERDRAPSPRCSSPTSRTAAAACATSRPRAGSAGRCPADADRADRGSTVAAGTAASRVLVAAGLPPARRSATPARRPRPCSSTRGSRCTG